MNILLEQEGKPKAIIMAGGAGVGKTFVTDKFKKAAENKGWVVLNPDQYARNPDPKQRLPLAAAAKKIGDEVDSLSQTENPPNIIWDTTANNPTKVKELQDAGYDVLMIMVYAHPSVAFEQNFARAGKKDEDSLPPYVVLKTWASSYNDPHIENYQKMFGDNFIIIDNTSKPGTDNSKIDAFNKAAQQGGKALEKHIGDIIKTDPEYYSSTQMVSTPANLSKEQQDDFDSKVQQLGLKLEEDDREAMKKLYQKYFEKNNEAMPLRKVGRKNGMEEVYKSYMSKKAKKDAEKSKVYNDISASIKNIGKSFLSIDDATSKAMAHINQKKINELTQFLVNSILKEEEEEPKQIVALFGGGFKPPTKGHLEVVEKGLELVKKEPYRDNIGKVKIIVGGGKRKSDDIITQDHSVKIWKLYTRIFQNRLPKIKVEPGNPFDYYKTYLKNHPNDKVYIFIGSRDGNEGDQFDVKQRTEFVKQYSDNVIPLEVPTVGVTSGTESRKYLKQGDLEKFKETLPEGLSDENIKEIIDIINNKHIEDPSDSINKSTEPLTPLDEAIIGDKIECDNCDWSWKIVDGGDDLFICHKCWHDNTPTLNEADPKKGTGKKPKGSGRRLYTDEDPKDTVGIKFSTRQDIVDTLNKASFKAKSHARQSQIINLIHQRVRAAYERAKDPAVKKRLKTGLDYITDKKEASKKKTQRLKKQNLKEFTKSDFNRVLYYKDYFTNLSPSTFDVSIVEDDIMISGINKPSQPGFDDTVDTKQIPVNQKLEENIDPKAQKKHKGKAAPFGSAYKPVEEINPNRGVQGSRYRAIEKRGDKYYYIQDNPFSPGVRQEFGPYKTKAAAKRKMGTFPPAQNYRDITENATYSSKIDYKQQIIDLTKHMLDKGMNIKPLPKVIFKHGDQENASQFLGKTAYYSPSDMTVVLYTEGRHPKDIARSFAHEMIHHIQNLEGRLHDITTTNTNDDDHLNDIEREAYTRGNMVFRNWTDSKDGEEVTSLSEKKKGFDDKLGKDPFGLNQFARELVNETFKKSVTIDMGPIIKALEFEMPTGQETDENAVAIIDAAPQGKVPHPVFLDFYAKFDKYFGEENDSRMLDNFGLEYLLSNILNLPNEDIQTVINHYNTTDQDSVEWFEQHDNELEKDEEYNIPGFNGANDDYESVIKYRKQQLAKSLEEQEKVRIFTTNCGCDKT